MVQWIRLSTLNYEVPGSNPLAVAVLLLGKALYPHHYITLVLRLELSFL